MDVFCRGLDSRLWTNTWYRPSGWVGWSPVGGLLASDPDAASQGTGHAPQIVVRGVDQAVWRFTWAGTGWTLESLGRP